MKIATPTRNNLMRRVVKLGGSLLKFPDLPDRVAQWESGLPAAQTLVVVGGGAMINAMRDLYALHELDEAEMHWRCVRLLRATFEIAGELFPHWKRVATAQQLDGVLADANTSATYLIAVDCFYFPNSPSGKMLTESWDTTADSIAAGLARLCGAAELHLLKSCEIPRNRSLDELARQGVVDRCLPQVAGEELPTLLHSLGRDYSIAQ